MTDAATGLPRDQGCRPLMQYRIAHAVLESQPGWIAPERWDVDLLLAFSRDLTMAKEAHLLVHCHAGVSRSTAAAPLVMAQTCPDRPADEVLREVVRLRPRAWPNLR